MSVAFISEGCTEAAAEIPVRRCQGHSNAEANL